MKNKTTAIQIDRETKDKITKLKRQEVGYKITAIQIVKELVDKDIRRIERKFKNDTKD